MTLLVIPDIHGQLAELNRVLSLADAFAGPGARIIFLGDLVDRGPDTKGVIQTLIDGISEGRDWIVLKGNHDLMFLDFLAGGSPETAKGLGWLSETMGGLMTLASYGVDVSGAQVDRQEVAQAVPTTHRTFLEERPLVHESDELLFVHAGIRPGIALKEQDPYDLVWIREPFLSDPRDHGPLVIHGHTSVHYPEHHGNRVNLDGGAGWGRELALAECNGRDVFLLTEQGKFPLLP